ncbi:MAG: TrmH family RNA methyltransferase [Patescibacteria group bacterium]|jgi:TrmH family RNA methyltransferase
MALKKYKKNLPYSYSFGVFTTLELLKYRPDRVDKVVIDPKGEKNKGIQEIVDICRAKYIKVEYDAGFVRRLSGKENAYVLGIFNKYEGKIEKGKDHVVLVEPSDTGNLGTVMRAMLGFGVENLAVIRPAVDVFTPKSVRASMGSVFRLNVEYFYTFEEYAEAHKNTPYLFMTDGKKLLSQIHFQSPYTLVFGNEGEGLPKGFEKYGDTVKISQSENIDSLNLSVAVGIALYQAVK